MTAINKQITFRLAPFLAWYPAKFAAPKMKVSRRQHCIIVYAVKWRRAESEKEWRKGIRTSVSFWACRFRQWRDKTKAKRPKLLACWFTRIQQPCQTYLGVGQLLYALIWHKREQGTSPATPCSYALLSTGAGPLCYFVCADTSVSLDLEICAMTRIRAGNFIEIETLWTRRLLIESSEGGWLVGWLAIGVKPSTLGSSACCCTDQVDQVNSGQNNQ